MFLADNQRRAYLAKYEATIVKIGVATFGVNWQISNVRCGIQNQNPTAQCGDPLPPLTVPAC